MVKSYRLKDTLKRNVKKMKLKRQKETGLGRTIRGGITALLGVALISQVAGAVKRI
ncbi:hypothetical protein LCGC14_2998360 [marine sediment metagenome]|uniref:Uncharacterized protein n=1 Tax=marine sediment metagenome TaxID=412755 RepID=A0A0F8ZSX0_9ZZZZ